MRRAAMVLTCILSAGCGGQAASPTASVISSSLPSASSQSAPSTSSAAASESVLPEPSGDLGPFTCTLPATDPGTTARAQITGIRVGTHQDYDRIAFEFDGGIPRYQVEVATPPFYADPSGLPLEISGSAFWKITFVGGTRTKPDGGSSYAGPTNFVPGFDALVQLKEGGDFEALSTWYVGLADTSCIRVLTLSGPARLVIDIQH
ncbi:MAG: hypothetical protein M3O78_06915 [Chloroflexota bacterium]|nr:hypothetical protein [Chloroflexota bacterium]